MADTDLLKKVLACPNLPTLPTVAAEVLQLTREPDVPLSRIAQVVQNDQALAGRLLKTVNSPYYGLATPCPTVTRAITHLGLDAVKSLVLGFSLVNCFDRSRTAGFDHIAYWRRVIYSAVAARTIATAIGRSDPETAFVGSLLQDVGVLAMHTVFEDRYDEILARVGAQHGMLSTEEKCTLGFDHAEAGAQLAEKWRLPPDIIAAIRYHHRPAQSPNAHATLVDLVSLSWIAAETLRAGAKRQVFEVYLREAKASFGLTGATASDLLRDIATDVTDAARLFEVDTGGPPDVGLLMEQANDQLLEHQIAVDRERSALRRNNDELVRRALTDPLTGLSNRARFDECLHEAFRAAKAKRGSVGLLFIDADRFKPVNDTLGHAAGDAVLVEIARRLRATVGEAGEVCRYGGEEFAIVLPDMSRVHAARLGEAVRRAIAAEEFALEGTGARPGTTLPVTVSVGVAAVGSETWSFYPRPESLVQAADKAVYGAKKAGRNTVRIFSPRSKAQAVSGREAESTDTRTASSSSPAAADAAPKPERVAVLGRDDVAPAPSGGPSRPMRILVVEDDALHANLIHLVLSELPGVEVILARTGEDAIAALKSSPKGRPLHADLALVDLELPGVSGVDVLRAIRETPSLRTTPVVVLSAEERPEDVTRCLAAGANAFIAKTKLGDDPVARMRVLVDFWSGTSFAA